MLHELTKKTDYCGRELSDSTQMNNPKSHLARVKLSQSKEWQSTPYN